MEIHFATKNQGKVRSFQRDLGKYNIVVINQPIDLIEPRSSDVQEIAHAKIQQAYAKIQKPVFVVDAGFYIDELNGFPRAFVNFSLETIGLEGILKLMDGMKNRECVYKSAVAFCHPNQKPMVFSGERHFRH